ncbi:hypothetical protein APA63_30725 [Pseudomonas aeruginosa]|nr:hypothetical protein APA63_30725 [Pseudomonas aeruginosa]
MWSGDITYIWTQGRWHYLAAMLDLQTRRVIGWAFSVKPDAELVIKALDNGLRTARQATAGAVPFGSGLPGSNALPRRQPALHNPLCRATPISRCSSSPISFNATSPTPSARSTLSSPPWAASRAWRRWNSPHQRVSMSRSRWLSRLALRATARSCRRPLSALPPTSRP